MKTGMLTLLVLSAALTSCGGPLTPKVNVTGSWEVYYSDSIMPEVYWGVIHLTEARNGSVTGTFNSTGDVVWDVSGLTRSDLLLSNPAYVSWEFVGSFTDKTWKGQMDPVGKGRMVRQAE